MPDSATNAAQHKPPTSWNPTPAEQAHISAIDATLERMRPLIATDPYIVTIPQESDRQYHHYSRSQAESWLSQTPFHRREPEVTQYQTFILHEPGECVFMQLPSRREDQKPPIAGSTGQKTLAAGATPKLEGPKKKISLDAYKKKQAGVATPEQPSAVKAEDANSTKKPAVKGPVERVKAESEDILAAVVEPEAGVKKRGSELDVTKEERQEDLKRKRIEERGVKLEGDHRIPTREPGEEEPVPKRARTETKSTTLTNGDTKPAMSKRPDSGVSRSKDREDPLQPTATPVRASSGMPPRLSPSLMPTKLSPGMMPTKLSPGLMPTKLSPGLMPSKLSPLGESSDSEEDELDRIRRLPSRLSPTLPDDIIQALEALKKGNDSKGSSSSSSITKDKEGKLVPVPRSDGVKKQRSPKPASRNGFRGRSSSSDEEDQPLKTRITEGARPIREVESANAKSVKKIPEEKATLLVKLKYRKYRREDIARILRMRPRPTLPVHHPSPDSDHETIRATKRPADPSRDRQQTASKGVAQKIGPIEKRKREEGALPSVAQKHKSPDSDRPPEKRTRPDSAAGPTKRRPSTPPPHASASQDLQSSPAGGGRSSTIHATPSSRKDTLMPVSMKREISQDSSAANIHTPPSLHTPTVPGGSSNHARPPSSNPNMSKTPKQTAWDGESTRLQALGRELKHASTALLSNDRGPPSMNDQKVAAVKSVESLLCYFLAFTSSDEAAASAEPRQSPNPRHWSTLRGFYSWVKRTTEPFPPLVGLVCALGVVFNAHILDMHAAYPASAPHLKELTELHAHMHSAARDAESKLDVDTLLEVFPRTWAARTKKVVDKPPEPGHFAGDYKLPIGLASSPLRAARAAYSMLQEWMEREKLAYEMKLKLNMPSA